MILNNYCGNQKLEYQIIIWALTNPHLNVILDTNTEGCWKGTNKIFSAAKTKFFFKHVNRRNINLYIDKNLRTRWIRESPDLDAESEYYSIYNFTAKMGKFSHCIYEINKTARPAREFQLILGKYLRPFFFTIFRIFAILC